MVNREPTEQQSAAYFVNCIRAFRLNRGAAGGCFSEKCYPERGQVSALWIYQESAHFQVPLNICELLIF